MKLKELKERLEFMFTDSHSGIMTPECIEEWKIDRLNHEEENRKCKEEKDAQLATWFEQDEFVNGNPLKRLWLSLQYIFADTHGECDIPDHLIKEIARCLLPDIIAYCESEKGKAEFAKWKEEQERIKNNLKAKNKQ